jgi:hypothetical protein
MSKTILRSNGFSLALAIMLLGSFFIITSCGGGGGGGGGGVSGITYDGLITQASVTSTNANIIFSAVWNGGSSSGSASLSKASSAGNLTGSGAAALFKQMTDRALSDVTSYAARLNKIMGATQVNETHHGSVSGTLTITGSIDTNTMTGTLTMTYVNYNDGDGYTTDGTIRFRIDGFDTTDGLITDGTMSFTLWRTRSANSDISLTGSIRVQESFYNNTDTLIVNVDGRDNSTRETFRFQNFVDTTVYDNILNPATDTETISGRVYVRQYGYVEVTTTTPLNYTSFSQENPDSGGPVILAGAGGSMAKITPISILNVTIDVDADGNNIYEYTATYAWNNLSGPPVGP